MTAVAFPSEYFDQDNTSRHRTSLPTFSYFASAIVIGGASLGALSFLKQRSHSNHQSLKTTKISSDWRRMWKSLKWPALANFSCLCTSAVSPVFAAKILSVAPIEDAPILLRPEAFIPLAIVLWNIGDLVGSVIAVTSQFLVRRPCWIFILSISRVGFIPLYLLCNIDGKGSFAGDWFYLIVVQLLFGLSHGWLSGASMMGVPAWVGKEDREEGGAFMGMVLVAGLVAGSVVGLAAAQA
jgi:solute carrier family 29 (equilibrative nucleoside transporter), member 1/2/3